MRYIRLAFTAALAVVLIIVALANRDTAQLRLLPEELAGFLGWSWSLNLPLFVIIFGSIIAGILIGFVWEWFREHRARAEGARAKKAAVKLATEVAELKKKEQAPKDDVLALIEDAG